MDSHDDHSCSCGCSRRDGHLWRCALGGNSAHLLKKGDDRMMALNSCLGAGDACFHLKINKEINKRKKTHTDNTAKPEKPGFLILLFFTMSLILSPNY